MNARCDDYTAHGSGNLTVAPPAGIRVVILDSDDQHRSTVRRSVYAHSDLVVVAECRAWVDCKYVLQEMLPELLIARSDLIPPEWPVSQTGSAFPLTISIGEPRPEEMSRSCFLERVCLPLQEDAVRRSLEHARTEVFSRKAAELSYLLNRYASHAIKQASMTPGTANTTLPWRQRAADIGADPDTIVYLQADRNYVRVHTVSGSYEVRETMTHVALRLDATAFVRIHRSIIINLTRLKDVVWFNATPVAAVMEGGTRMKIGPNYRAAFRQFVAPSAA